MDKDLREILQAGLAAADPKDAVLRSVRLEGDAVLTEEARFEPERIFVVAAGKAAGAMARAAEELFAGRVEAGLVVTKEGHDAGPEGFDTVFASHPEPDEGGVEAARRVREMTEGLGEGDLLVAMISGGASALLADPAPPIELADLKRLTQDLLRSGADIGEINTVRKHVSVLKGGGRARLAAPAKVLALLLSDVVGDAPSSIASGPAAPDTTTLDDTRAVLQRYSIEPSPSIAEHLARAEELGYAPLVLSTTMTGDARSIAAVSAAVVRESLESGNPAAPPCAVVSGGEATVVVRGDGTGGPNQEFALTLAVELDGVDGWAAIAADTDGNDGPTDAAGGMVDGGTAAKVREAGVDPVAALEGNDARAALEAGGALLVTGPTGTNVNDLRVVLVSG